MPKRMAHGIELLADPTRRQIVALLTDRSLRPTTIAREIGLSRPAVSRQLRLLREAGLIDRTRSLFDGRAWLYRVRPAMLRPIVAWLAGTNVGRSVTWDERGVPRHD